MKWISSAEIFNIAICVSILGLKKQVPRDVAVIEACVVSEEALDGCLRLNSNLIINYCRSALTGSDARPCSNTLSSHMIESRIDWIEFLLAALD